ncbi:TPA: HNH endonuclease signature motif containing protein [Photobacterium damselae]
MKSFLTKYYPELSIADLTIKFNAKFNLNKTTQQVRSTCKNHGIHCGRRTGEIRNGKLRVYTSEQKNFLVDGYKKWDVKELTSRFNDHFNESKRAPQIRSFLKNHKIKSGRTGRFTVGTPSCLKGTKGVLKANKSSFKPGAIPHNHLPIGAEIEKSIGYIYVKVGKKKWVAKQRIIYEQHYGPIPDGNLVRFKDGNRRNFDPNNLFLVDLAENAKLTKLYKFNALPLELRDTAILLNRIDVRVERLTKEN